MVQTTLSWHHIFRMRGKTCQCKQRKQRDCLMFIHSYFHFQWHSFKISCSCMVYIKKKHCRMIVQWHRKWSDSDVTLVIERQQLTWHHVQNVVSLRVLYKFVNFYLTLVICLKFVLIEMLDKLITYIVCWYKTLYQVLPVTWTYRITTSHYHDSQWYTGSQNRLDLIQGLVPPHYVCNRLVVIYWFTEQARPDTRSCTTTLCM